MTKCEINKHAKALYCYEYKGRYCHECGFDSFKNPWLMDFHHINPEEKEYTISHKIRTSPFEMIKEELDKCILLCSHCHRTLHAEIGLKKYNDNLDSVMEKLNHIKNNGGRGKVKDGIWMKYTREEIENYINDGKTIKDISIILNEKYNDVKSMLLKYKLKTIGGKRIRLDNDESSIVRDYTKFRYTIEKIMERKKMTKEQILNILEKNKVEIRIPHHNQKKIDINKMEELLAMKTPKVKIAETLGCTEQTIYRLIKKHNIKTTQ
jgi:hypothetical protein